MLKRLRLAGNITSTRPGINELIFFLRKNAGLLETALQAETNSILAAEPDIVGFSVLVGTEELSLELARRIKHASPRTAVIFGGAQCLRDTLAAEMMGHDAVDAVALGEADFSLAEFARRFSTRSRDLPKVPGFLIRENGRVIDCGDAPALANLDDLPFMDFDSFNLAEYAGYFHLSTSRGCVRKCSFCTHILQQKTFRTMSAERAASEIHHHLKRYPEQAYIEFGDSLINGDVRRLAKLSVSLAQLRAEMAIRKPRREFGWGAMAILHKTTTRGLLKQMRAGGCQVLFYGLESGSRKVIRLMNKKFEISEAETVLRDTKSAGIDVGIFVMVGFPGETEEDFKETLDFIRRNASTINQISTSVCDVQKGSHLDVCAEKYGIKTPIHDRLRWELADGSNTYEIRLDRHHRLVNFIKDQKIPLNAPTVRVLNRTSRAPNLEASRAASA